MFFVNDTQGDGIMMVMYFYFSCTTSRNCIYIYTCTTLKSFDLEETPRLGRTLFGGSGSFGRCCQGPRLFSVVLLANLQIYPRCSMYIYRLSTYSTLGETWPRSRDMLVYILYMERLGMF